MTRAGKDSTDPNELGEKVQCETRCDHTARLYMSARSLSSIVVLHVHVPGSALAFRKQSPMLDDELCRNRDLGRDWL